MKQGESRVLNSYSDSFPVCFGKIMYHLLKTLNNFDEEILLYYPTSFSPGVFKKSLGIQGSTGIHHFYGKGCMSLQLLWAFVLLMFLKKFCVAETALWEVLFILWLYEFFSVGYSLGWVGTCSACHSTDKYMLHSDVAASMTCIWNLGNTWQKFVANLKKAARRKC